jgi:hypothetical protein
MVPTGLKLSAFRSLSFQGLMATITVFSFDVNLLWLILIVYYTYT